MRRPHRPTLIKSWYCTILYYTVLCCWLHELLHLLSDKRECWPVYPAIHKYLLQSTFYLPSPSLSSPSTSTSFFLFLSNKQQEPSSNTFYTPYTLCLYIPSIPLYLLYPYTRFSTEHQISSERLIHILQCYNSKNPNTIGKRLPKTRSTTKDLK